MKSDGNFGSVELLRNTSLPTTNKFDRKTQHLLLLNDRVLSYTL